MRASRPELPKEFVAVRKRRRITDALAELSAEKGYEATKIADIVRRAGVARKTLYDNFEGKEEVLLAALELSLTELVGAVEAGCESGAGDWRARVEAGVAALLTYVAENPAAAQLCLVEALSATPAAAARYDEAIWNFVVLLERATPEESDLPATLEETLVGGVAWILNQRIRRGEARSAEGLRVELSEFILSPYHGVADPGFEPRGESNSTVADLSG